MGFAKPSILPATWQTPIHGRIPVPAGSVERPRADLLHGFVGDVCHDDTERIYTDEHSGYNGIGDENTIHESVNHSAEEWVRGDVHTNSVEGVWSLFKRSVIGSFHQVSAKHLDRYLNEFEFRFNNPGEPLPVRRHAAQADRGNDAHL